MLEITQTMSNVLGKIKLEAIAEAPKLWLVGGILAGAGAIATAIIATTKAPEVVEEHKAKVEYIHNVQEEKIDLPEDKKEAFVPEKELTKTYGDTAIKMTKLYLPTVLLAATSLTCILVSNHMLNERVAGLSAAYAALDTSYREYRKRVCEKYGEEEEHNLYYDIREEEETIETVDPNTGEVKTETNTVKKAHNGGTFHYLFDETTALNTWEKQNGYNSMFLKQQEFYVNNHMRARGYIFLNEVLDALGLEKLKTPEGQVLGWIWDEDNPKFANYISFHLDKNPDFVDAKERSFWIELCPDGNILDLVKGWKR